MPLESIWEDFTAFLPGKRVYFIYTHKNGQERFRNGLTANTEISHFAYNALRRHFPRVTFLRLQGEKSHRIASITPNDVVIGHGGETFLRAAQRTKKMIFFAPWAGHADRSFNSLFNCMPLERELEYWEKAKALILLTSEYNKSEYIEKKSNFWFEIFERQKLEKEIHVVHQPIDCTFFKRIKWEYETDDFLYIGNDAHMKGLDASKKLIGVLGRKLSLYGVEGKKLSHLDTNEVEKLPKIADFFIQPGMWEGQCVSILESAARGFIPVVSKETGYPYDHPFLLRHDDFEYNLQVLKKLLVTSACERKKLGDALHLQLVQDRRHNCWEELTSVLVDVVQKLYR